MRKSVSQIRQQFLDRVGVTPTKGERRMISAGAHPDCFPKTDLMKLMEYKYNIRIEEVIFTGSLNDLVKKFNGDLDRSTLSKWRKQIRIYLEDRDD